MANEVESMFPDTEVFIEEEVDNIIYDVPTLNTIQERLFDILIDRGKLEEEDSEDE